MGFAKCILHCGHAKTGSTAVQSYLKRNRRELLAYNVYYPDFGGDGNHHCISYDYMATNISSRPFARKSSNTQKLSQFLDQISKDKISQQSVLVLSSESFFSLHPHDISNLVSDLRSSCDQITFLVYVRNPFDYFPSLLQTQIKNGVKRLSDCYHPTFIDYISRFQLYRDLLRENDALMVRDSARKALQNSDICDDFMSILRLHSTTCPQQLQCRSLSSNTALSLQGIVAADYMQTILRDRRQMIDSLDIRSFLEAIPGDRFTVPLPVADILTKTTSRQIDFLANQYNIKYTAGPTHYYSNPCYSIHSYIDLKAQVDKFISVHDL